MSYSKWPYSVVIVAAVVVHVSFFRAINDNVGFITHLFIYKRAPSKVAENFSDFNLIWMFSHFPPWCQKHLLWVLLLSLNISGVDLLSLALGTGNSCSFVICYIGTDLTMSY